MLFAESTHSLPNLWDTANTLFMRGNVQLQKHQEGLKIQINDVLIQLKVRKQNKYKLNQIRAREVAQW